MSNFITGFATPNGEIKISDISKEIGTTGERNLGQADGRHLAGIPSGIISMNDYKGKTQEVPFSQSINVDMTTANGGYLNSSTITVTNVTKATYSFSGYITVTNYQESSSNHGGCYVNTTKYRDIGREWQGGTKTIAVPTSGDAGTGTVSRYMRMKAVNYSTKGGSATTRMHGTFKIEGMRYP